jgi:polar amino acid transport system substrate-binding protein
MMKDFFIFIFLSFCPLVKADVISMRTDLWCPYACDPKSDKPGFMVEMAKEVFKKYGHTIDYNVMNWARAVSQVKEGKFNALIGCNRADVEGFEIPTIPTGHTTSYYYTLKDDPWMYVNEASLQSRKIGVINDYTYGDEIDKLIRKKKKSFLKVTGENPLLRLIQMTEAKRINGFVENPLVLAYNLREIKKDASIFKVASTNVAQDPELFIAFSPASSKSRIYAKNLDEGMIELRKSGRLKIILERYGLSDWQK